MRITALVPAHNEEAQIGETIQSLYGQRRPPETIIVIADNCTDRTVEIARGMGVQVYETVELFSAGLALERILPARAR
ncbi:glycosyltransferase [Embleya sp. NPDC008237]|uniref:glycosyltransferase n=1 Tax=Embleya sp. NPDC008237 TaxID=3363978 RepID=UPI0036E6B9F6